MAKSGISHFARYPNLGTRCKTTGASDLALNEFASRQHIIGFVEAEAGEFSAGGSHAADHRCNLRRRRASSSGEIMPIYIDVFLHAALVDSFDEGAYAA